MKKRLIYSLASVLVFLVFLPPVQGWAQAKPGAKGAIITHAFAVEKGNYGFIWKIYIEAENPNGQMLKIASVVSQPGFGYYPTDWIYLKPQYQKRFRGYIQWNTFSSKAGYLSEWTQITLRVSIIDKDGNESNEVVFPFTFESGIAGQYQYELPAPFNEGNLPKLGNILIDLYEPTLMSGGDARND